MERRPSSSRRTRDHHDHGSQHSHIPSDHAAAHTHTLGSHRSQAGAESRDRHGGPAGDQRSRASQDNHGIHRARREGGQFSPPPRASTRRSSDPAVKEDWLSRSHDAEEGLDRAFERSKGSRSSDAVIDRRGLQRGQSDGEPLLAQSNSPRHKPAKPGDRFLLRHIFQCGRLALQARHPDFGRGTPQTVKVLKEAVEMSKPLLEEVRGMIEGSEKGKGGGGLRGKVKRAGFKWVGQQVEEAERHVRRLERRERRKERGRYEEKERKGKVVGEKEEERGAEGVEDDDIAVEAPSRDGRRSLEGGDEEPESSSQRHSHRAHNSDAASGHRTSGSAQPGREEQRSEVGCEHENRARSGPLADENDVPDEPRSRASRREHASQPYAGSRQSSHRSSRRSKGTNSAHAERVESRPPLFSISQTQGRQSEGHKSSRADGERSSSAPLLHQEVPGPGPASGGGLAAEYYNSFDQSSTRGERSERRASRSWSTLRPEDSTSVRSPGSRGGSSSWSDTASRLNEREAGDDRGNHRTHSEARRFRQWARRNAGHHRTDDGGQGISTDDVNILPPPIGTQRRPSRNRLGGPDA